MSDKLQSVSDAMSVLPDLTVLTLSGRDCIAFAHAQFMSDVAGLVDGQWQWSGWLTPKGRVVALFAAIRRSQERLDLLVLDADAAALAASLKRYVFRSKVALDVRSDLQLAGRFGPSATARGAWIAATGDIVELDMGTAAQPRTLTFEPRRPADAGTSGLPDAWRAYDIAHGLPRLGGDQREQWTPQQLSLERLNAFSVAKGCYPGQEIVARTHFLGQAKRGLVGLRGASAKPGDAVTGDGQTLGGVVSSVADLALAVLPLERADALLAIDGQQARVVPLLGGLER